MRVAHLLRKYDPSEWGGTETAVQRLFAALKTRQVDSVVYCPSRNGHSISDPLQATGCQFRRFRAFLPIWGISPWEKQRQVAVGGNLMSFDLMYGLWREPGLSLIHTHALGRLGGIAVAAARLRDLPVVVTVHGGFLDVPAALKAKLRAPARHGWEWGRLFGLLLRTRRLMERVDAILTCNPREAALLRQRFPRQRIVVQPHGVPIAAYAQDHRQAAREAFPQIRGKQLLLCVGRIDPIKNQGWLIEQAPATFQEHPDACLLLAGACTDQAYGTWLEQRIQALGLADRVFVTGGLPPNDPRLIGLFQETKAVLLASSSETFGLVLLEAWAAGAPVISSRTSGAAALVQHGRNGWLFDLSRPQGFHEAVRQVLAQPDQARQMALAGSRLASAEYDSVVLAERVKQLYEQLIEEKNALRHNSRR